MRERPILFSGPMVSAILDGRKTQTRRIIKPARGFPHNNIVKYGLPHAADPWAVWMHSEVTDRVGCLVDCPYGKPGERLWVRETWRPFSWREGCPVVFEFPYGARHEEDSEFSDVPQYEVWIERLSVRCADECEAAGIELEGENYTWGSGTSPLKWRPSIHMPRWASRITLEVTGVRAERLQDISEEDADAEGADTPEVARIIHVAWSKRDAFAKLWESINGKGSWDANPWVWVVDFSRAKL